MDLLLPTQIKHQTARLLHYVILVFLILLLGPLRHLWQLTIQLPTLEPRPILIHIQASHLLTSLFRRSNVLHTTTSIVLTSLPAWFTRSNSRSLPTPTIPESYSLKRSPCPGFPNVVILSTTFTVFRATGSGPCAQRIIGDIILRFLYHPFHNVPIEPTAPTEATHFTPKIQDLAQQLSITLRAAMASGELNDTWRMLEDMSFRDAIQTLQAGTHLPSE